MIRYILSLLPLLGLVSCFEDTAYDTHYLLTTYEQRESSGDYTSLSGVKGYAFSGSTDDLYFESYDNAEVGIITSIESGEQFGAFVEAQPYEGSENRLSLQLDRQNVVIVMVDPSSECYAYTNYTVPINFSEVLVDIVFRQWKESSYTASTWTFVLPEVEEQEDEDNQE